MAPLTVLLFLIGLASVAVPRPTWAGSDVDVLQRIPPPPGPASIRDAEWYGNDRVWVAATGPIDETGIASAIELAAAAFARHFVEPSGRGLVVDISLFARLGDTMPDGFAWTLPWPLPSPPADTEGGNAGSDESRIFPEEPAAAKAYIRSRLESRLGDLLALVGEEQLEAFVEQAWEQLRADSVPGDRGPAGEGGGRIRSLSLLPHEIGHRLFLAHVRGNSGDARYGGDAPDWLDEAAAILMEDGDILAARRARFGELVAEGGLVGLAGFLEMAHPSLARSAESGSGPEHSTAGITVRIRLATNEHDRRTTDFYAQTRGFIDFLLETTGEDRVFLEIALFLKAGGTMDGWLAESETARIGGLGGTVEALERRWLDWIDARHRGLSPEPRRHP